MAHEAAAEGDVWNARCEIYFRLPGFKLLIVGDRSVEKELDGRNTVTRNPLVNSLAGVIVVP